VEGINKYGGIFTNAFSMPPVPFPVVKYNMMAKRVVYSTKIRTIREATLKQPPELNIKGIEIIARIAELAEE